MSVRPAVVLVAVTCAVLLASPAVASAAPPRVTCGTTLTVSTVLRHDLSCIGDGLRLAPGVTLDLRGHTLRGAGAGVGVLVEREGAQQVRNGTLTGWATAIGSAEVPFDEYPEVGPLTVDKVRFRGNRTGVDASGESGSGRFTKLTTITRSEFTGSTGAGVDGGWFARVKVDASTFTENRFGLFAEGDATITRSRFVRNTTAVGVTEGSVDVADSEFVDNSKGISTGYIGAVVVERSTFRGSTVAIDGAWSQTDVHASTFTRNGRAVVVGWMGGTLADNVLRDNDEAISGGSEDDEVASLTVQGNKLRANGQGIVLVVAPGTVSVGGNEVRNSTGWGIHVPGAIDLGGNKAYGNGSSPQCVGVVCRVS